jgi:hypothetical protein
MNGWLIEVEIKLMDQEMDLPSSISFAKAVTEIRFKHKGIHLFT